MINKLSKIIDEVNYQARWMPVQLRLTCDDNFSRLLIAQFWAFSMAARKWHLDLLPILDSL